MEILALHLANFRNFVSKKIIFDENLTVIIGPNGSGKSNILQAISLLSSVRPVHIEGDIDLVKFGKSEAKIAGLVVNGNEKTSLVINFLVVDELHIKKSYLIDNLRKRLMDFTAHLAIIVFHPEDLDLVSGSPSLRRHHLDAILASSDRDYWRNISAYNKIVTRRNKVLLRVSEGKSKPLELSFWDARLVENAQYVSRKRKDFFDFLNTSQGSAQVSSESGKELSWRLKQSMVSIEKLRENQERDIAAGVTLSGPHRDDFRFFGGGRDLEYFGSRGEQRMAVLYLKLAELEYLAKQKGWRPILALDDIFSELDWEHREAVLSVIGNQQTIITAAERESVPKQLLKKAKVVEL